MTEIDGALRAMAEAAADPLGYARAWKEANGRPVVGLLPMHFPGELAHAAGVLPSVLQEDDEPVAAGLGSQFSFYCGFNRSIIDQAVRGEFSGLDAIILADHCVQLLGTADILRARIPEVPVLFNQLISSMTMPWAADETRKTFSSARGQLEALTGQPVTDEALKRSIAIYNRDRQLIRRLYDLRREGRISLPARRMQEIVKSSMVMDKEEHAALLEKVLAHIEDEDAPRPDGVRLFLSGHFCHAPKPEILDLFEDRGATIVNDDLYTGYRYVATDVAEEGDPLEALTAWYFAHNRNAPCATLADKGADLDKFLVEGVRRSGADGLVVLLVKFCEPHMYVYPEIKERCEENRIPNLLVETEHEGVPLEALKTRVETFVEMTRRLKAERLQAA